MSEVNVSPSLQSNNLPVDDNKEDGMLMSSCLVF